MSLALSGADVGHLAVAVGLTYALGFERSLRGATAGDRVFALIGTGSGGDRDHRLPRGAERAGRRHHRRRLHRRRPWCTGRRSAAVTWWWG